MRTRHFFHLVEHPTSRLSAGGEGAVPLEAKLALAPWLGQRRATPPACIAVEVRCSGCGGVQATELTLPAFDDVQMEHAAGPERLRPDITLLRQGHEVLAIEVRHTHPVSPAKAARLALPWLEVDAQIYLKTRQWQLLTGTLGDLTTATGCCAGARDVEVCGSRAGESVIGAPPEVVLAPPWLHAAAGRGIRLERCLCTYPATFARVLGEPYQRAEDEPARWRYRPGLEVLRLLVPGEAEMLLDCRRPFWTWLTEEDLRRGQLGRVLATIHEAVSRFMAEHPRATEAAARCPVLGGLGSGLYPCVSIRYAEHLAWLMSGRLPESYQARVARWECYAQPWAAA